MMNSIYTSNFDGNVLNDLKKIDDEIKEVSQNEDVDREQLLKLRLKKLYRGMELNSGFKNNYKTGIPY